MIILHFINRLKERRFLEKRLNSNKSELIILYGRRRVGKTFLLEHSLKQGLFFSCDLSKPQYLMNTFFNQLKPLLDLPMDLKISTWDEFFSLLKTTILKQKIRSVVFDEFQYIPQRDESFLSIFQRWWDKEFKKMNVFFVLCGSYVGMIERMALSQNSPLYGRRTGQYRLMPMDFFDSSLFLSKMDIISKINSYAVLGGIPIYLLEFSEYSNFKDALLEKIFSPGEFLLEEGRFLTLEEFRKDPSTYFTILNVISSGRTKPVEISTLSGVEHKNIGTYLSKLLDLQFIRKEFPFSMKKPKNVPLYFIEDDYLRFYFKYIFKNIDKIYRGMGEMVAEEVLKSFSTYVSFTFEKIAKQYLIEKINPDSIGRWWDKGEEIDLVAVKDRKLIVGECKWTNKPVDNSTFLKLKRKSSKLLEYLDYDFEEIEYYLFSKSGFKNIEKSHDVHLVDLEEISKVQRHHVK
ncbi:ATP-binding protein [Mesoaciditoga lauensis]|uniref:ATP-binding protein n=1 Tax=Mesoaciditoga lauensis TaxID=1495039 RepID=UPI000AE37044|nr:ATP-binding protein [Mesoaciditoga lauensis]